MTQLPESFGNVNLPRSATRSIGRHLRSVLVAGVITAIPLFVTILLIQFVYGLVTKFSQAPASQFFSYFIEPLIIRMHAKAALTVVQTITVGFLALLFTFAVVYVLGLLGTFVLGKRLLESFEHLIEKFPLVKGVYGTTKQVIGVFRQGAGGAGFQRVVLVEFPRVGMWTAGFVTNSLTDLATHEKMVCVFIPMTPNPTSGFFQIVREADVRETGWQVDQGIKIVLSGGLLAPTTFNFSTGEAAGSSAAAANAK